VTGQRAEGKGQKEVKGQRAKGKGEITCTVMAVLLVALLLPSVASAQQTIIFVRHAERADSGASVDMMTAAPADPPLTAAGEARANKLAAMLADAGIKAIFATEFKRAQETGKPLAVRLGLVVQTVPAKDPAALIARLKSEHPHDIVLVVGHSTTLPDLIKAFGGRTIAMRDDEYDAMYVLTPATGALVLIRY
jgi:broad specificity phosphatase PhoE